ncbi:MAG: hypothetical protein ACKO3H_08130 [Verrucomicrobiota bacterium]
MAPSILQLAWMEPPFPALALDHHPAGIEPHQPDLESRGQTRRERAGAWLDFDDVSSLQTWIQCHGPTLGTGVGHPLG